MRFAGYTAHTLICEIAAGFGRMGEGGGWLLFGGIVSVLLGAMIWALALALVIINGRRFTRDRLATSS